MRSILFFDSETTGLPEWKEPSDSPDQPHIVQLAAILSDPATGKTIQGMDVIIKPEGYTIPQDMTDIHGITTEMAMDLGVPLKLALEMILALREKAELHVAHNTTFDNRMIRIELKRIFGDNIADDWKAAPYYCTMINSRKIMGKQPSLSDAYTHFTGHDLVDAHRAMADTLACMQIYYAINGLDTSAVKPVKDDETAEISLV